MDYQDHIADSEKENKCLYCGEPCEKDFCNKDCYKAEMND